MTQKGFSPTRSIAGAWFRLACWLLASVAIFSAVPLVAAQTAVSWLPVSKEDLDLKDNPLAPGEPAIILYHEVQTDSAKSFETHYTRIKILKDSGKEHANVEIPFIANETEVGQIPARTIAPDGKPHDFDGSIFDRVALKSKRFKITVKSFTLPDVQVGSIIEYSYSLKGHQGIPDEFKNPGKYSFDGVFAFPAAQWSVQQDLFARRLHFVLHPYTKGTHLEIESVGLVEKMGRPQTQPDGSILWDLENIAAFHEEDYAPPEDVLRSRVEIFYIAGSYFSSQSFWSTHARLVGMGFEKFLSRSKVVQEEAAKLAAGLDSPEAKLRKLYDRTQQLRLVSFERTRTEKEQKHENLKPNKTAEEVLTRGYAYANEANLLFVALAREAGFLAHPVLVTGRNRSFFIENMLDTGQLNAMVVEVRAGAKLYYLDPATLHCPFGLLPWEESDTQGIRAGQYGGGLVSVPAAKSADAVLERHSSFKMDSDGNLQGKLDVTFRGQEALSRRLEAVEQDEAGRRKALEDEVKAWLPQNSVVKLSAVNGWEGSEAPLQATFELQVPGFASQAGGRLLVPAILFHSGWEKSFQSSQREHPVYLEYGHQESDDVTLELPGGVSEERVPAPQGMKTKFASYQFSTELQGSNLKLKRQVSMDGYYFTVAQYPVLRDFYDFVRANDEELAVLHAASATAAR